MSSDPRRPIVPRRKGRTELKKEHPLPDQGWSELPDWDVETDGDLVTELLARGAAFIHGRESYDTVKGIIEYGFQEVDKEGRQAILDWSTSGASYSEMPPGAMRYEMVAGAIPGIGDLQALRDVWKDLKNREVSGMTAIDLLSVIPGAFGAVAAFGGMLKHSDQILDSARRHLKSQRGAVGGFDPRNLGRGAPPTKDGHTRVYRRTPEDMPLDPADSKSRTRNEGSEKKRRANEGEDYVPRLYYYDEGATVEPRFQNMAVESALDIPNEKVYDLDADPDELLSLGGNITSAEKTLKEGGQYAAMRRPSTGQVILFEDGAPFLVQKTNVRTGDVLFNPTRITGAGAARMTAKMGKAKVLEIDRTIAKAINENPGGGSMNLKGDWPDGKQDRYMVAPSKATETMVGGDVTPEDVAAFREAWGEDLRQDAYVGWWKNDDGEMVFDVSRGYADEATAQKVSTHGRQDGIYDVAGDDFIPTATNWNDITDAERIALRRELAGIDDKNKFDPDAAIVPGLRQHLEEEMVSRFDPATREWYDSSNTVGRRNALAAYIGFPEPEDFAPFIALGHQTRGWYANAAQSLSGMGEDAGQFAAVLASLSPQTPVPENLRMALDLYREWDHWGRPMDADAISEIFDLAYTGAGQSGRTGHIAIKDAAINNIVTVLTDQNPARFNDPELWRSGEVLSGLKVDAFYSNVMGELDRLTFDTHAQRSTGMKKDALTRGRRAGATAGMRRALDHLETELGLEPGTLKVAEGQESSWEPARQLDLRRFRERMPNEEILFNEDGTLNPEAWDDLMAKQKAAGDFSQLMHEEGNLDQLAALGRTAPEVPHRQGFPDPARAEQYAMDNPDALRRITQRMDAFNRGEYLWQVAPLGGGLLLPYMRQQEERQSPQSGLLSP